MFVPQLGVFVVNGVRSTCCERVAKNFPSVFKRSPPICYVCEKAQDPGAIRAGSRVEHFDQKRNRVWRHFERTAVVPQASIELEGCQVASMFVITYQSTQQGWNFISRPKGVPKLAPIHIVEVLYEHIQILDAGSS